MMPKGKVPGVRQKPLVTHNVVRGLADILETLPASFASTPERMAAIHYLIRFVDYCSSQDYQDVREKKRQGVYASRPRPDVKTYTNPETGETWMSGKPGRAPDWVKALHTPSENSTPDSQRMK